MKTLSPRQAQVHALLLAGKTVEQIGVELGITVSTVRVHITAVHKKIGIKARRDVVHVALDEAKLAIRLPRRQFQVLKGILMGKSFPEIALEMNLSIDAVQRYRYRLYKRLGVTTRAQVIAMISRDQAEGEER